MSETDRIKRLMEKPKQFSSPYEAGYDAGLNGPDTTNCHFGWFGSPVSTKAWEEGKRAGDAAREALGKETP